MIFGTGPLGRAVAAALKARGTKVRLINRSGRAPAYLDGFEVVSGDLTDTASARHAAQGATVVYHCAGAPYTKWSEVMPAMMAGAIDAAASAGARLVFGDNLYAYTPTTEPLTEETPEHPKTEKGRVRKEIADTLRAAHAKGRVEATIGRASDFYGPYVETSAVGDEVFGRLANRKPPRVLGDPDQPHSFTFIEDFGRALVVLAEHDESFGQTWHVPNALPVSTREFAARAAEAMGHTAKVKTTPSWLLHAFGFFNPMMKEVAEMLYQWEKPFVVDHTKFKRAFGDAFSAVTALSEGICKTAEAFKTDSRPAA
ncbi:MAG TPA: NAD-dependent epimerase/dehydratase family protein [Rhodothermales bacterium]|nr:NAD-dependent epimerase/dehydratase family protein [Rhodothermales bacterium]